MKYTFTVEIWKREKPGQPISTEYKTFRGKFPDDATAKEAALSYVQSLESKHLKGKEHTDYKYIAFLQRVFDRD